MPKYLVEREIPHAAKMSSKERQAILWTFRNLGPEIQWVTGYVIGDKIHGIYNAPSEELIRALGASAGPISSIVKIEETLPGQAGKRIFQPEDPIEILLGWLIHSNKGRQRHDWAARRLERQRVWIGAFAAVVSGIVGASVFTALQKEASFRLKVGLAAVSMISAVLVSLSAFLNLAERAEKHRAAGVRYKGVIREIERRLGKKETSDVANLGKELNEMEASTPIVPERIYVKVDKDWNRGGVEMVTKANELLRPSSPGLIRRTWQRAVNFWW